MRRCLTILFILVTSLLATESAWPQKKKKQAKMAKAVQSALPPQLTSLFPMGREFLGVSIPSYSGDAIQSVMNADIIERTSEQYLDLTNLVVLFYNSAEEPETTLTLREAVYDLISGQLISKTPALVEQPRFTLTGDKMTFELQSRSSTLTGNVRLIVPDVETSAAIPIPGTATDREPKDKQ